MSVNLEAQLRSYRHNFDSEAPPVDTLVLADGPVIVPDRRLPADHRWRPRRGLAAALTAAVVVLVVVGGVGLISNPVANEPDPVAPENGWIAVGEGGDIWLVALDQEPFRVIGSDDDGVEELCPAFSPDGRRLAYGRWEGEVVALAVVDVDADGRVTDPVMIEVGDGLPPPCPLWSPDGKQIAFGAARTSVTNPTTSAAGSEVGIVNLSDSSVSFLPGLLATDLEWSPDGTLLAIASGVDQVVTGGSMLSDGRISLYEPASGELRSIEATLGAIRLTWAPDGQRIAYQRIADPTGDSSHELRVIDIDTEQQEMLAAYRDFYGIGPVWSPDGEWILYQRCLGSCGFSNHELALILVSDSEAGAEKAGEVVVHPFGERAGDTCQLIPRGVTWSPDGRYLLHNGEGGRCGNLTFLATVPIDLEMIRSELIEADGEIEVNLAATPLAEPDQGGSDGRYDERSLVIPIQTWGVRLQD
jgi:hypothetical protein